MIRPHRNHPAWWAFAAHRASGVLLALFLPVHFLVLGLALEDGGAALDRALRWTDAPLVKAAETALIVLLAVHLSGGLRLLAVEFLPWRDWQKTLIALAGGVSLVVGFVFLVNVV